MENAVKVLTGITAAEEALLTAEGVINAEELSLLTYEDLTGILPDATTVKKRKLELIREYVQRGEVVTAETTIMGIQAYVLSTASTLQVPAPAPTGGYAPDPSRGAPKLYIDSLKEYSGNPIEFENWELATKSTLGQTTYVELLLNPPDVTNIVTVTRDRELFHMLVKAMMNGSAMHILQVLQAGQIESGHAA